MEREDWTNEQNDAIVADYFSILAEELESLPRTKAEHNRALQQRLGRSKGSISFKYQNISAILKCLGEDWIFGYKPAFNFQGSLADAVARWLAQHPDWLARGTVDPSLDPKGLIQAPAVLWIGPPPTFSNMPVPVEIDQMIRIAAKFDVAERDARNRALGKAGEERVLVHERATLEAAGRSDLARKVRWVSSEDGDGAGYDIASFDLEGAARLIEVKTTNGWERTPFHISRNELETADQLQNEWCLLRLWNFNRQVKAFELRPPLTSHVMLTANSFSASLL